MAEPKFRNGLVRAYVKAHYTAYILDFGDRDILIQDEATAEELELHDSCDEHIWISDEYYEIADPKTIEGKTHDST